MIKKLAENLSRHQTLVHIFLLLIIWLVAAMIINPIGEFPFGDDWSFSKSVKTFNETSEIRLTGWVSMTLIGHLFWGIGVSEIFGFSHTVLRISIVFLAFIGLVGYYFLLCKIINQKFLCLFLVILLGFNPVFTLHAYSFYTDISFFAVFIWCLNYFLKFFENKTIYFLVSILFLILAFSVRDLALVAVPAFIITMFIKNKVSRNTILYSFIIIAVSIIIYFVYRYWITEVHGLPINQDLIREKLFATLSNPSKLIKEYTENSYMTLLSIGFHLLPIVLILFLNEFKSSSKLIRHISLIFIISFVVSMTVLTNIHPRLFIKSSEMVIGTLGINEVIERVNPAKKFELSKSFKLFFLAIGFFGMSLLLLLLINRIFRYKTILKNKLIDYKLLFIISIILIYLALILTQNLFTRYLIPIYALFPIFLIFTHSQTETLLKSKYNFIIFNLMLAFFVYLGVSNPRDNLEFNRNRWEAINTIKTDFSLKPEDIDGGFEFTAWHYYVPFYISPPGKNWWWVIGDDFSVAPGYIEGYKIIKVNTFKRFFPPCYQDSVFALKKIKD